MSLYVELDAPCRCVYPEKCFCERREEMRTIRDFRAGEQCLVNGYLVEVERHARRTSFVRVLDERLPGRCRVQLDKRTVAEEVAA